MDIKFAKSGLKRHLPLSGEPVRANTIVIPIILAIAMLNGCGITSLSPQAAIKQQPITPHQSLVERKQKFFDSLRAIILIENTAITVKRARMLALKDKVKAGRPLSDSEDQWLRKLAAEYRVRTQGYEEREFWGSLTMRVDIIPVELALAQAANESAWGTSRFAREGNNYFGQWCHTPGCGIVPARRAAGMTHEVRRFTSASESVHSYIHNLNSSAAYAKLRSIRSRMRQEQVKADAMELARGLGEYSGLGEAYILSLRAIIRKNRVLMNPVGS